MEFDINTGLSLEKESRSGLRRAALATRHIAHSCQHLNTFSCIKGDGESGKWGVNRNVIERKTKYEIFF